MYVLLRQMRAVGNFTKAGVSLKKAELTFQGPSMLVKLGYHTNRSTNNWVDSVGLKSQQCNIVYTVC